MKKATPKVVIENKGVQWAHPYPATSHFCGCFDKRFTEVTCPTCGQPAVKTGASCKLPTE
jgi:hypothetical protein